MMRDWWTTAATTRCTDQLAKRASTYLVTALCLVVLLAPTEWTDRLVDLMRLVAILGVVMTVHDYAQDRCPALLTLASFLAHLAPILLLHLLGHRTSRYDRTLGALVVALPLLALYAATGAWPYSLSPATVTATGLAILIAS